MRRDIIEIDEARCDGCGDCVTGCAEGALQVVDGKAKLVGDVLCDGLGACVGECPRGALKVVQREAVAFDEEAVERHLASSPEPPPAPGGCPGAAARSLAPARAPARAAPASLQNWPIQLRLLAPNAPFLADADVLLAADCAPAALTDFHHRHLPGHVLILACPKLDPGPETQERIARLVGSSGLRSLTVLRMMVPCCGGLAAMAARAREAYRPDLPMTVKVIGLDGQVLQDTAA